MLFWLWTKNMQVNRLHIFADFADNVKYKIYIAFRDTEKPLVGIFTGIDSTTQLPLSFV